MNTHIFIIYLAVTFISKVSISQTDTSFIKYKNIIGKDLQVKLSGVKYAVMNTTKEEVENAISQRDYQDLFGKLGEYLNQNLGIKYFAFTESQRNELFAKNDISTCDLVEVGLDPGKFTRSIGAMGVYRRSAILYRFCDSSKYRVELSDISVDGYSYHPNRFAAAFKRVGGPKIVYTASNKLSLKRLPIYYSRLEIDSLLMKSDSSIIGE